MDFEWQTRAPGDATSPFYQLGLRNNQAKKRENNPLYNTITQKRGPY